MKRGREGRKTLEREKKRRNRKVRRGDREGMRRKKGRKEVGP